MYSNIKKKHVKLCLFGSVTVVAVLVVFIIYLILQSLRAMPGGLCS